jgi:hypothetical protein
MSIKDKINGRNCAVVLSGASVEELRKLISLFEHIDLCWCGINTFHLTQQHVLSSIRKEFDIVMDVSEVANVEEYEVKCRVPRVYRYLHETEGLFITSRKVFSNINRVKRIELEDKVKFINDYLNLDDVHNSLMAYLFLLTKEGANRIYLFGCDGYQGEYIEHNAMMSYFCPREIKEDYQIAFPGKINCALPSDTIVFNGSFQVRYLDYCTKHKLVPREITNANTNSFVTIFPRKTISEVQYELRIEQDEVNRKTA